MNMTQTFTAVLVWIKLVEAAFIHKGADALVLEPAVRSFWLMHGIAKKTQSQHR
jgi:hypothetical protein